MSFVALLMHIDNQSIRTFCSMIMQELKFWSHRTAKLRIWSEGWL